MNSQQLLIVNFIILSAIVVAFWLGRSKSKQQPTLLKMRDAEAQKTQPYVEVPSLVEPTLPPPSTPPVSFEREVGPKESAPANVPRAIYFVYNGHEWEAHEVMGLKRGEDLHQVTQTYQRILKTADVSTLEFYEAAYSALLKSKNKI